MLPPLPDDVESNSILFKHNHIYSHNITCVSYTTYDIQYEEDDIHTFTCQHNIVVLSDDQVDNDTATSRSEHPFAYGQVLGIYHMNMIYIGPRMTNYQLICLEFLWIQWYRRVSICNSSIAHKFDCLKFCSVEDADAFSFINLLGILHGCHIIPRFWEGQYYSGRKVCHCALEMLLIGRNAT